MGEFAGMNDRGRFSLLGAWALAFGCALGWDALSIPWTTLLPAAGPLGTAIGVLAGGLAMALVALCAAGADPFDLLLTDIWMPNLDGEGLARAVRDDPALRGLRIVAVTADVEFSSKAAAAGFDGVLLNPVTADKLASIIRARA